MKSICIYQRVLPHYRISFFEALYDYLKEREIALKVVVGYEREGTVPKTVLVDKPWVEYRKNNYVNLFGRELVFQRFLLSDLKFDGIIVEQSNRLLLNYLLIVLRLLGFFRLGLWGHGKNFQSSTPFGVREKFKAKVSKVYDWWFCYTTRGKDILVKAGCPDKKITVVKNSIDLSDFDILNDMNKDEALQFGSFSVGRNEPMALYCGGMYPEKRIDFLLSSLIMVKKQIDGFKVVFVGDGPDSNKVREFSQINKDWFFWAGAKSGKDKVPFFHHAKVFLMPGLVGLAVLDSFASGVPMLTTDIDYHSPEIDYLIDGYNGLIVKNNLETYVAAVVNVLDDSGIHKMLREGCVESAKEYSVDLMAANYGTGIVGLLGGVSK